MKFCFDALRSFQSSDILHAIQQQVRAKKWWSKRNSRWLTRNGNNKDMEIPNSNRKTPVFCYSWTDSITGFHSLYHRPVNEKKLLKSLAQNLEDFVVMIWKFGHTSLHIPEWGPQITLSKYGFLWKLWFRRSSARLSRNLRSWGYLSGSAGGSASHPNWCNKVPVISECNWPYIHTTLQGFILYRNKGGFNPEKLCSHLSFGGKYAQKIFQTTT